MSLTCPDSDLAALTQALITGKSINPRHILSTVLNEDLDALLEASHEITMACADTRFRLCSIINAKGGACTENCAWCAQSRHWNTGIKNTPLVTPDACIKAALLAKLNGVEHFSLVTSGRKLSKREVREAAECVKAVSALGIKVCASMGLLNYDELALLKNAGLTRYHCNLESSERFFSQVCTSHTMDDKLKTLKAAHDLGLELCSGGLLGMGETWEDRLDLALKLKDLPLCSSPINFLSPIAGTPLGIRQPLTQNEILRSIVLFRMIMPNRTLRLAGGRGTFTQGTTEKAMYAGANAVIAGDFLTTRGEVAKNDKNRALTVGFTL